MNAFVAGLVLGTWLISRLPTLHESLWLLALGLPLVFLMVRFRWLAFPVGLIVGAWLVQQSARAQLELQVPSSTKGVDLKLSGHVTNLPTWVDDVQRFTFNISDGPVAGTVMLGFTGDQVIKPGDVMTLTVRLAKGQGTFNRNLFDYSGWMLMKGLTARGHVKSIETRRSSWRAIHHQLRFLIRQRLLDGAEGSEVRGLLVALAIGDHQQVEAAQWQMLSLTGTNHLLIVSGLHIGLVMGACFAAARMAGIQVATASVLSIVAGTTYGAIAGFGLPVQRSLMMATCIALSISGRKSRSPFGSYAVALGLVVMLTPLAVLSPGFYLSFAAVAALLLSFQGRVIRVGKFRQLVHAQAVVTVALVPVLLLLFHEASLVSFLVNLVAIPWVSVLVIPPLLGFVLLFAWLPSVADLLLTFAEVALTQIWGVIAWLAMSNLTITLPAFAGWSAGFALLGACLLLLPAGVVPRYQVLVLWLPLITQIVGVRETTDDGRWRVSFIDVGQGMSVLVQAGDHAVLYDAGPRFGQRFDAGAQIVVPYLKSIGIRRLDHLVVSHNDTDHAGGVAAVLRAVPVALVHDMQSCRRTRIWRSGGFQFRVFRSPADGNAEEKSNNLSCLLQVTAGGKGLLLTGDVERPAEARLRALPLSETLVMSVPHHGSRTSSTPGFLNQQMPNIAVVSSGSGNRFGHPHADVVRRYHHRHVRLLRTDTGGEITIDLKDDRVIDVNVARESHRRFWHSVD